MYNCWFSMQYPVEGGYDEKIEADTAVQAAGKLVRAATKKLKLKDYSDLEYSVQITRFVPPAPEQGSLFDELLEGDRK